MADTWIKKAEAVAAMKAGAVLHSSLMGHYSWFSLTTAEGTRHRLRITTFDAVLAALGPRNFAVTKTGVGSCDRRYKEPAHV